MVGTKDDSFTARDQEVMELAKMVVRGVFILSGGLFLGLFILSALNKDSSIFKEIISAFIAVGAGLLGSVLGYYYKNNN